jgi:hypothetical protein
MSPRVQKLVQEAVELSSTERLALIKELVGSIDVSKKQMDRQRRAVLDFLAIPTANSGVPDLSSNKYGLTRAATSASEPTSAKVWANPEDDVYDQT